MCEYLGMTCKDSDYSFVITVVRQLKRIILVRKLTLVVELYMSVFCVSFGRHCISFDFHWMYSSKEGPTKFLTTLP